ncbi:hypothetical protein DRF62_05185 [Chryseobacterium piscium]|uniref:Uncharacterized protein n=1 Tax=Chryseobacterium piscium TaxID=333702 RepID=A0A3D9BQL4_9FLAO|nr:hypothetical protein [Chryseobacterium piscium]REC55803.1 hypothetical protein DRF62_05185 [Chryseobacterium piscium]
MKNKYKVLLSLAFILILELSFAQSRFDLGYGSGYSSGYCQDKANCISPISPIPPIPSVTENSDSYKDGYNRGFKDGLQNNKQETRTRYKTAKPKFYNNERNSNSTNEILLMLLKKKRETEEKVNQDFQQVYSEIENYEDNNSEEVIKLKTEYLNKTENLANSASEILKSTNGNYKHLLNLLQDIYDEFYEKVQ